MLVHSTHQSNCPGLDKEDSWKDQPGDALMIENPPDSQLEQPNRLL